MTVRQFRFHAAWLLAGLLAAAGCGRKGEASAEEALSVQPPLVEAITVQPALFEETFSLIGELKASRRVLLSAEVAGQVVETPVEEGRMVEAAAVIARIDAAKYEAAVQRDEANARLARLNFERAESLHAKGAMSDAERDQIRSALDMAESALKASRYDLERATLRAPFAAWLNRRDVETGQLISPGQPVAELLEMDPLEAHFELPEADLAAVQSGMPLELTIPALDGRAVKGTVQSVSRTANTQNRTYLFKAALPNADGTLADGMFVRTTLVRHRQENAISVPQPSVIDREGGHYIYVIEEGDVARIRFVQTGSRNASRVVITEGLKPGDRVITNGHRGLSDRQKVEISKRS